MVFATLQMESQSGDELNFLLPQQDCKQRLSLPTPHQLLPIVAKCYGLVT
jgi:hypothetical protein